ncbi:POU domain, class 6, transcription factor 2 [Anas platyrhynchos]|uniref:POU domain, class 6, transcription factor 2 n=1 Tax=Anas platyrhynchos TaxID=8839 RepID=R0LGM5_ANAPL|nr:POU domain, class 6, transcription factor 2 [Anas platyrhynchos]
MIAGQVSKPLLSLRSEMNAELRGEDKAATSDNELNEPLLAPVESNDSEDTPSKLFVIKTLKDCEIFQYYVNGGYINTLDSEKTEAPVKKSADVSIPSVLLGTQLLGLIKQQADFVALQKAQVS